MQEKKEEIKSLIGNSKVSNINELNELKAKFLGKSGIITLLSNEIKNVEKEKKKEFGMMLNELKNYFNEFYDSKKSILELEELIQEKIMSIIKKK